jgi:hypothetical protein
MPENERLWNQHWGKIQGEKRIKIKQKTGQRHSTAG